MAGFKNFSQKFLAAVFWREIKRRLLRQLLNCFIDKLLGTKTMEKKYLQLNDIESYRLAFGLSNYVWAIVVTWNYFAKDTVGKQFVRAVDSISANIAEGFGRF